MEKIAARLPFGIPPDLGILALTMFFWGLGEGLFIYFYPLALQRWNTDMLQIGGVLSLLGVIMALVQAPAGYLSDRFGTLPLIRAGLILGVIAAAIMAAAKSLPFFILGLSVYTITSFVVAPINSYITSKRGSWSAQRGITFVAGSMQFGAIVGPMLGGWIGQTAGFAMVFRYSCGLFLIGTVITFFAKRSALQQDDSRGGETQVANALTNPRFNGLLLIIFFTIIALSTPQQLTSVFLQDVHQLSLQQIGMTGTFAGIGATVILFALGSLRAPAGMIAGQLLLALFCLVMWRGQNAAVFYFGYLFVGGYRLYRSMAVAAVQPLVKASAIGLAYGLVETANALAVILAPLVAGFLYNYMPEVVYTVSLISLLIAMLLTIGWHSRIPER